MSIRKGNLSNSKCIGKKSYDTIFVEYYVCIIQMALEHILRIETLYIDLSIMIYRPRTIVSTAYVRVIEGVNMVFRMY